MREQLEQNLARFEELEKQLLDPAVQANGALMAAVYREHGSLAKVATKYRRFKELNEEISEAREMMTGSDPEMRVSVTYGGDQRTITVPPDTSMAEDAASFLDEVLGTGGPQSDLATGRRAIELCLQCSAQLSSP